MILGFSGGVDMAKELRLQSTQGGLEHNFENIFLTTVQSFSVFRVPSPISVSYYISNFEVCEFNIVP